MLNAHEQSDHNPYRNMPTSGAWYQVVVGTDGTIGPELSGRMFLCIFLGTPIMRSNRKRGSVNYD